MLFAASGFVSTVGCEMIGGIDDLELVPCEAGRCVELQKTTGDAAGDGDGALLDDGAPLDATVPNGTGFSVGGTVLGLFGSGLVLQLNGGRNLSIVPASGQNIPFAFAALETGSNFAVSILGQPSNPTQRCTVSGGTGVVGTGNVTSVVVNCTDNTFVVGGSITGLEGSVVLKNNDGDNLSVTSNGTFAFPAPVANASPYAVSVASHSALPVQTCTVSNGTGSVASSDVTNISVVCTTATYTVGGTLANSTGTISLTNNATDTLTLPANGPFTFGQRVSSNRPYDVKVATPPPGMACSVTNGSGTVTSGDVGNVQVTCASATAFTEKFDGVTAPSLPAGWSTSVLIGPGSVTAFVTDSSSSDTAPNSAFVEEAGQASDIVLVSPSFMVGTNSAKLTFRHSFQLERNSSDSSEAYDGAVLEISVAGGPYQDILAAGGTFETNGYLRTISTAHSNSLGGRQCWAGSSGGFITTTATLPATAGQQVSLRFRQATDKANVDCPCVGWRIDTISVTN
jgi:hypothetical protein